MQALEPGDPRSVGRCRILARVAGGGTATVYFGRSAGGRALAVKLTHAEAASDPAYRERFRNEVDAARAVCGGYSPAFVDADPEAERPWLATAYLPSVSLQDAVRSHGPLPAETLWPLAVGIAEGLFSFHRAGVTHLDLRPANVLLTTDGPKLIGLGNARPIAGERADGPAWDVYAFGATLAFAGTGSPDAADVDSIADEVLGSMITRCLRSDLGGAADRAGADRIPHLRAEGRPRAGWPAAWAAGGDRPAGVRDGEPASPASRGRAAALAPGVPGAGVMAVPLRPPR